MLSIERLVQIFCNVDPRARRCSGPMFFFCFLVSIIPQTWRRSMQASLNLPHELGYKTHPAAGKDTTL
jgi:hypothetical protein